MLHIFRKYQRYIYVVITFVIVISFSFFGTYSAMQNSEIEDPTAFIAVDGTHVPRSELEKMVAFIGTDSLDKRNFGGVWGPNFFNDGLIKSNFLETGAAQVIAEAYPEEVGKELQARLRKEKLYKPYQHPQAGFISEENLWNYFVPGMAQNLSILQNSADPLSAKAFEARMNLYLSTNRLPAPVLKNVLLMQEKQHNWVEHDSGLDYADLSLFGYHTVEDWFGPSLIRLIAEFIINSSIIAQHEGYVVTTAEAYADLMQNASISFAQNQKSPHLGVANLQQYIHNQLQLMHIDEKTAVKQWQKILLFKRLFNEMGSSVFVAPLLFQQYNDYARQSAGGDLYQLPPAFRFSSGKALQKFEIYLDAVSNRKTKSLDLPTNFKSLATLSKETPQLIQNRYQLEVAAVSKKELQPKVTLKNMWHWEEQDKNWTRLTEQFPELALAKAKTSKQRFAALESLDPVTRGKVDGFARAAIVDEHPEWISEALKHKPGQEMTVHIPLKGGKIPFEGVTERQSLIALLDNSEADGSKDALANFSGDNNHYYRITVLNKSPTPEIMTYEEADKSGVLDELLDSKLQAFYEKEKESHPKEYKNKDGSWKNYSDLYDSLADKYFAGIMQSIGDFYVKAMLPEKENKNLSMTRAASLRFLKNLEDAKGQIEASHGNENAEGAIVKKEDGEAENGFEQRAPLGDQWKLLKKPYKMVLNSHDSILDAPATLALPVDHASKVYTPPNGDLYFFYVREKEVDKNWESLAAQVDRMQYLLSNEAKKALTTSLIKKMREKGNLNVEFLMPKQQPEEEEAS